MDLTQLEVMKKTGINNKTLSGYENGVAEPDIDTLTILFNLYGISADEVLKIKNNSMENIIKLSDSEYLLIQEFRNLENSQKKDLLLVLKALNKSNQDKTNKTG